MSYCCSESEFREVVTILETWLRDLPKYGPEPEFLQTASLIVDAVKNKTPDGLQILEELKELADEEGISIVDQARKTFGFGGCGASCSCGNKNPCDCSGDSCGC